MVPHFHEKIVLFLLSFFFPRGEENKDFQYKKVSKNNRKQYI